MSPKFSIQKAVEEMDKFRQEIADFNDKFLRIKNNFAPYLTKRRESREHVEYLTFGTSLIEYVLINFLFPVLNHAATHTGIFEKLIKTGIFSEVIKVKKIKPGGKDPFGALIDLLNTKFQVEQKYPTLYKQLCDLRTVRNDIVHRIIDKYEGDMSKANNDLDIYAHSKPIEAIWAEIYVIQNSIVDQQVAGYVEFHKKFPKPEH